MTKRNERTSPRLAKSAAKYLAMTASQFDMHMMTISTATLRRDIRALAASCLTQTADKPKRKPARRRS